MKRDEFALRIVDKLDAEIEKLTNSLKDAKYDNDSSQETFRRIEALSRLASIRSMMMPREKYNNGLTSWN